MTEIEIAAWQLNDVFDPKIVAALIIGVNPHEVNDGQVTPILKRMREDYVSAKHLHMQGIENLYEGVETISDAKEMLEKSLQSIAMIHIVDPNSGWDPHNDPQRGAQYDPEEVKLWLSRVCKDPQPWKCSNFEVQEFSRKEIVSWLEGNNISSAFPFNRESQSFVAAKEDCSINSGRTPHRTTRMDAVEEASANFWGKNVRDDDHDTHSNNEDVERWLLEHPTYGKVMSDGLAKKIATIVRPSWARKGKPPQK